MRNAIRFVKEAGADAVKLEGAGPTLSRVRAIVGAGIPVMGHIGLTPQSATMLGGFKAPGPFGREGPRPPRGRARARGGGLLLARPRGGAGPRRPARDGRLAIPTIGIGAGAACDGQVLVWHDLLGLYEGARPASSSATPRSATSSARARALRVDVRERRFPEEQHTYAMPEGELEVFERALDAGREAEDWL